MLKASDVIVRARDVLAEFDVNLIEDKRLFWELTDEVRRMVERLIQVNNAAFPFPSDYAPSVDVGSAWAESYAIPNDGGGTPRSFWRARRLTLTYGNGRKQYVQLVEEKAAYSVPQVQPSAYIIGEDLYPVDGVSDGLLASRVFGWNDASTVDLVALREPLAVDDKGDDVEAPDEALPYLGYWLAKFMATRAKADDGIVEQIRSDMNARHQELIGTVEAYPGPPTYRTRTA